MSEEQPDAKDGLGKDIKNCVRNDLAVDIDITGAVSNTPDTNKTLEYMRTVRNQMWLTWGRQSRGSK